MAALLALALLAPAHRAGAEPLACKREIAKASAKYAQARMKALQKCEDRVLTGKIPGPCPDGTANAYIGKAAGKLQTAIDKRCGGADRHCGTGADDDALGAIGWNIGACPNFENRACTNAIATCADVATCVACIGATAVDQAIDLYYDALTSTTDATVLGCQRAIGRETAKFYAAKSKALARCENALLANQITGPCPDAKAATAIGKAEGKKVAAICRACGGGDRACGGGDDLTPAQIGVVANCPGVDPPGAEPACGAAIVTLQGLVACVDCVTEFKADCVDAAAVPAATSYPSECNAVPPACGDDVLDAGEQCDGTADAACPGQCQPTCSCPPPACVLPNPIPSTLALVAKPGIDLDTGWTGVSHDIPGVDGGALTAAHVSNCDLDPGSPTCGECDIDGPVQFPGPVKTCRCYALADPDTSSLAVCDPTAPACGAGETCECFYGPPLPISSGGVPVCVVNRFASPLTGTANIADAGPHAGEGGSVLRLRSSVHNGLGVAQPCPTCDGDPTAGDGVAGGTCHGVGTPRDGQPCDAAGASPLFGATSFDCLPSRTASIGNLDIAFDQATTGTTSLGTGPRCTSGGAVGANCFCDTCNNTLAQACNTNADCPPSGGNPGVCGGKRCVGGSNGGAPCAQNSECPGATCSRVGTPTAPNQCNDGVCSANPSDPDNGHEGLCEAGPVDRVCSTEPFRGCNDDVDCNPPPAGNCTDCAAGQSCDARLRECFLDPIVRSGTPGVQTAVLAATFCIPPTGSSSVNNTAGLPGPGAIVQPTRLFRLGPQCGNGALDAGEGCDPPADSACPGQCQLDCRCPGAAVCGDDQVNQPSEQCDGTADGACPGACQADCTCGPFCGDDQVNQPSEQCDGAADTACPGHCQASCRCPICGDDAVNQPSEQCDGNADAACPGACRPDCTCGPFCGDGQVNQPSEQCDGAAQGVCQGTCEPDCTCAPFCGNGVREGTETCDAGDASACPGECGPDCTCPAIGDLSFVVRPGADLDTGWTGTSHDFSVQAGATISGEIGACDPGVGDLQCTFFANVGSFCSGDPSRSCTDSTQCVGAGSCVLNTYGAPLPLSSGGVPVCIVNRFSGDVTGTFALDTGAAAITVPLNSLVYLATDVNRPCPICDCGQPDPQSCQLGDTGTCSDNPLINCTVEGTGPFGPTSNQCPPNAGTNVSGGGLNLAFAPATTATSSFASNTPCTGSGFQSSSCWGPGQTQPSACERGCDGGSNDGQSCSTDGDCPGAPAGACKPLCRQIVGEEVGEGACVIGPVDQTCAQAHQVTCTSDAQCPGIGPCVTEVRRCFLDPIVRIGQPGLSADVLASTFFIPATSSPAVNNTAGLPGPGAIRFPNDVRLAYCGDNQVNRAGEECDGSADANCPGACLPSCACNVTCGNNTVEFGEQCDGTQTAACSTPGQTCVAPGTPGECTCTPTVCGDGFHAGTEQCDPGGAGGTPPPDDAACPGQCNPVTCQCPAAICGNGVIEPGETCELPAVGCGPLQLCAGCTQCLP